MRDYYAILGIDADASQSRIRAAYQREAQRWHPDKNGNSQDAVRHFQTICAAYRVLKHPTRRSEYDRLRRQSSASKVAGKAAESASPWSASAPRPKPTTEGGANPRRRTPRLVWGALGMTAIAVVWMLWNVTDARPPQRARPPVTIRTAVSMASLGRDNLATDNLQPVLQASPEPMRTRSSQASPPVVNKTVESRSSPHRASPNQASSTPANPRSVVQPAPEKARPQAGRSAWPVIAPAHRTTLPPPRFPRQTLRRKPTQSGLVGGARAPLPPPTPHRFQARPRPRR